MTVRLNSIIINKNVSKCFESKIGKELATLPTNTLKTIKNNGGKYVLAPVCSDINPIYKGLSADDWRKGATYDDDVDALCCYKEAAFLEKVFNKDKSPIKGCVYHESAHIIDKIFLEATGGLFCETQGFKEVYGKDLLNIYKKYGVNRELKLPNEGFDYFIQGSRPYKHTTRGLEETFAEVFTTVNDAFTSKLSKHFIEQNFPNTIEYVDKFMYLFGGKKRT